MSQWYNQQARDAWKNTGDEARRRLADRDNKNNTAFVTQKLPALRERFKSNNDLAGVRD